LESYNWAKERIYAKKKEDVSVVKRRKRKSKKIYNRTDEKKVYQTIKVTINCTSILYKEEGWEKG